MSILEVEEKVFAHPPTMESFPLVIVPAEAVGQSLVKSHLSILSPGNLLKFLSRFLRSVELDTDTAHLVFDPVG